MENLFSTEVILAVIASVSTGVAYLVKHFIKKRDEEHKRKLEERDAEQKRIFAERDADKQAMKDSIAELKTEVKQTSKELKTFQALIIGCEHEDCPNRAILKDYLLKKD